MIRIIATEGNFLKRNVPYKVTEIECDLFDTSKVGSVVYAKPKYYAIGPIEDLDQDGNGLGTFTNGRMGLIDVDGMNNNYQISAVLVEGQPPSEDLVALSIEMHNHIKTQMQNYSTDKGLNWTVTIE